MKHIVNMRMFCRQIRLIASNCYECIDILIYFLYLYIIYIYIYVCIYIYIKTLSLFSSRSAVMFWVEVIGNDNAEKIQILPATIARTDRNCPEYHDNYEDENTFYAGSEGIWGAQKRIPKELET